MLILSVAVFFEQQFCYRDIFRKSDLDIFITAFYQVYLFAGLFYHAGIICKPG